MLIRFCSTLSKSLLALCLFALLFSAPARAETTASKTAVIAAGQSVSSSVPTAGSKLFGLIMPAAWTAADVTFQASFDGGATWIDWVDNKGSAHFITPVAGAGTPVDPTVFAAVPLLRLRSGTSAVPVAQAASRTITFVLRSF